MQTIRLGLCGKEMWNDLEGNLGGFFSLTHAQDYDRTSYSNDIQSEEQ